MPIPCICGGDASYFHTEDDGVEIYWCQACARTGYVRDEPFPKVEEVSFQANIDGVEKTVWARNKRIARRVLEKEFPEALSINIS